MHFKLVYGNHGENPIHLMDTLLLLRFGLEHAGHKADLERFVTPGKVNIIVEHFSYDFLEVLKELRATPGTDYIIVATEFLTGETFNHFESTDQSAAGHYDNERYWQKRYHTFLQACQHARAVWHLSAKQAANYAATFEDFPTFYLPHGYAPELDRVHHKRDADKDIDVLFTGTSTPYRQTVLDRLRASGLVVCSAPAATNYPQREDLIARSRIAVNIRQNAKWRFPSNSRFHYHITNSSLLISELCEERCDLSSYVCEVDPEKLCAACVETIQQGCIQQIAGERLAQFRKDMPIAPLFTDLLEKTFR